MQQISLFDEQFATNHCQLKKTCPILVLKALFNFAALLPNQRSISLAGHPCNSPTDGAARIP
jgi:hypothetical protein